MLKNTENPDFGPKLVLSIPKWKVKTGTNMVCHHFLWLCLMKIPDINYIFLRGMMNSGHKGSKNSVHKGVNFHPTSTRVFRGPTAIHTSSKTGGDIGPLKLQDELTCSCLFYLDAVFSAARGCKGKCMQPLDGH